ncbi:unnamed protein product [Candidula unifasciata]|uniref:Serine/threonine-protein kinase receptor n=1 Tax=Candidula unifasciata TaxID=100452 RepID=A0A8S3YN58_9EUPU|nr:unnamed protein product [Candidula unifasciata]
MQWVVCLSQLILHTATHTNYCKVHKGSTVCEKYDRNQCLDGTGPCVTTIEECANLTTTNNEPLDEPHNHMLCFASWLTINNSQDQIIKKGCWMNDNKCYEQPECVEDRYSASVFFCCCDGDLCNKEYIHRPSGEPPQVIRQPEQLTKTLLYSIVPILGVGILVVTLFFMWRRHQHHMGHTQLPTVDPSLAATPTQSTLNIHLLELRARGRYGSLWKAQLADHSMKYVAVKIFPLQDKQSWMAELDIYNLPHMKHENVLRFFAPEKREDNLTTELWLIAEFHEKGSLCDYLKANTVTWAQLCRIGESMTCGLAYLHDEIPATYGSPAKPAIAHRDFKSKNVLLKQDLTACIADFGLALKFEPGKVFNETHPQVGTRRYMAPEVLEGAICFNLDSFLRIDMYACGLIIWELMTRCSSQDGPVDSYRLPFEAEVGLQPTLEEMQTLVVTQRMRPAINPVWRKHSGLGNLISTVEECWDQDAEARLSAGCVKERIGQLARIINSGSGGGSLNEQSSLLTTQTAQVNRVSFLVPSPAIINGGATDRDTFVTLPPDPVSC